MILKVSLSGLPSGTPSIGSKLLFFSSTNCRLGSDDVILYAPVPGGGLLVWLLKGVLLGTTPENWSPRTAGKVPSGSLSVTVTSPVLSSVSIPEMSAVLGSLAFTNSSAPLIFS